MEYEDSIEMAKVHSRPSRPVSMLHYNKEDDIMDLDDFLLDTDPRQQEREVKNLKMKKVKTTIPQPSLIDKIVSARTYRTA